MRYQRRFLAASIIFALAAPLSLATANNTAALPSSQETILPFLQSLASIPKIEPAEKELPYTPGEVIVKFKQEQKDIVGESGRRSFSPLSGKRDFEIKEMIDKDLAVLRIERGQSVVDAVSQLKTDQSFL